MPQHVHADGRTRRELSIVQGAGGADRRAPGCHRVTTLIDGIECVGGPIDGERALPCKNGAYAIAFPWPNGWYYFAPNVNGVALYLWKGEHYHAVQDEAVWKRVRLAP